MLYTVRHGRKTVTTTGTREQLTTNGTKVGAITIQALRTNTNVVYVGDSTVSSSTHFQSLAPGGSIQIGMDSYGLGNAMVDMSKIWLDVVTSGEGVVFGFLDRQSAD